MKKTFLAGLATLLPIAVTIFLVVFVVDLLTAPFAGTVEDIITEHGTTELAEKHKYLLIIISRIVVLIIFFFAILILGFFGRKLAFSWFINFAHRVFYKIPIIKTIYRISREISASVFSNDKKKLFKGTVSVPFPHEKCRALGLLSGDPPYQVQEKQGGLKSVFIPTAPHPVSGFLVMYNQDEIRNTNIETEDLFKFLLSCGLYHPGEEKNES
ncbi:MAG: DUF502 domain-containing protein [Simkaniaceae bacterium]|nr:MAG: DUF502 domain-containing protein [Simkaniaceae bacterium]